LFCFLPLNGISFDQFSTILDETGPGPAVGESEGYYFVRGRTSDVARARREREENAARLWKKATLSMHVIKRFPFVRGVFVSGDLSKNATTPESDIDFFIVTEPGRLWISRSLLIAFKKLFLLNSRKYFCLNYLTARDHLEIDERNIFIATEIAHLKPLYNTRLFHQYLKTNNWIQEYFPNFSLDYLRIPPVSNRKSILQWCFELPFLILPSNRIDRFLMDRMRRIWASRYPDFDDTTRKRIFRSTRTESRAYAGNYQDKILSLYQSKLAEFGLDD
ncbi:MAG: hypothetical protein OEV30_12115, partial [Ignavibacteria bacterium]|nr:hypothetical protein [Ignavibacteria bacterium]